MYLLGFDIGSSSVKGALIDAATRKPIHTCQFPVMEMPIDAPQAGWAEQDPDEWWKNVCKVSNELISNSGISPHNIGAIGIAYQMHGLVLVDRDHNVIRPSIIWCDSRAVDIGRTAFDSIGHNNCMSRLLNSPGNFTASKYGWVIQNEPGNAKAVSSMLLPGDFIALRMTGTPSTTATGLSEGVLWDFKDDTPSITVLKEFGIDIETLPAVLPNFADQGRLTSEAAELMGLVPGIPVTYRAGDQPNNALSLGVFEDGGVAATGGTSGVIYAVTDTLAGDALGRVNSFAHVNHTSENARVGVLMCINGAGIQHAWMRSNVGQDGLTYPEIETLAAQVPIGSEGLRVYPYGNGAERIFQNSETGATVSGLQFNKHRREHMYRAGLEGVAFSFGLGFEIMRDLGVNARRIRVGNDNLFQSQIFAETVASVTGCAIDVIETTGAVGAAIASGLGIGSYVDLRDAFSRIDILRTIEPSTDSSYRLAFDIWKSNLPIQS